MTPTEHSRWAATPEVETAAMGIAASQALALEHLRHGELIQATLLENLALQRRAAMAEGRVAEAEAAVVAIQAELETLRASVGTGSRRES